MELMWISKMKSKVHHTIGLQEKTTQQEKQEIIWEPAVKVHSRGNLMGKRITGRRLQAEIFCNVSIRPDSGIEPPQISCPNHTIRSSKQHYIYMTSVLSPHTTQQDLQSFSSSILLPLNSAHLSTPSFKKISVFNIPYYQWPMNQF